MKKKANTPDSIYKEQLQEIGSILKAAREDQQLHLEDVADKTLIRGSLLKAIETGDLDNLPEPIYTRGLIRRYGDILNLDGETLASQFFAPAARARRRTSWKETPAAQLRPLHLYAAYVVLMVAAVSGLSYVLRQTAPEASALPPLDPLATQPRSEQSAQVTPDNPEAAGPEGGNPNSQAPNHPIRVETTLTAQSWLRVVADGKTEFEGILQPGENRLWTANQALTVRAGNAGGVVVTYNDGQAEALGKPGTVAEITYSPAQTIGLAF
ncbi:RodZ domain-containing protein [Pseudanabaena sp. FACHB-2040]|uniref:helix-turn-helix domain-containing protein n=1 Tax=Pseudanabaena sp. FACHB-2040 TaxID=2692859 RepID=UPI001686E827|nr:RodZ domain-containing protein [Pseudanabaena sp. FACHB-2040]MBD2259991.1 helix-turn-helix domain-containing protein [Pseudanabaena sp. FACHB-2040]